MRLGVLDIGSNTVHLLVVDARTGGPPVSVASHKRELRLAEHLDAANGIAEEGVLALIGMIGSSRTFAEKTGCAAMLPFVTSALREAHNCDEVIARVYAETGVELRVLSGFDEARATFLAARRWYGWSAGRLAVFDIGGGSLEMAVGADEDPDVARSVAVGAGRMHRVFGSDVDELRRHVRMSIGAVIGDLLRHAPFEKVVATSKTFRSLGRITGAAPSGDGPYVLRRLSRPDLSKWVTKLEQMTPTERTRLPGVSAGRSEQILAGAIVAEAVMDLADVDELDICPWALREGVILNYLDHLEYWADGQDLRTGHLGGRPSLVQTQSRLGAVEPVPMLRAKKKAGSGT